MKSLYFFLLCLTSIHLGAQSLPQTYIIDSDSSNYQVLDNNYRQIAEDTSTTKWDVETVSSPSFSNIFYKNFRADKSADYPVTTYWIRFKLKNDLPHEVRITLQQKSAFADYYIRGADAKWIHKTTGYNKPWSQRDGYKLITAILLAIKPGEEITVYERLIFDYRSERPKPAAAAFGFENKTVQSSYVDNDVFLFKTILASFFIGLLVFAAIFNFFFFLIVRERVYLYYALCLLFGTLNEYHTIFFHVFFREHPAVINTHVVFFLVLVNTFAIQMERYFLHTFSYYPRWDKVLQSSALCQLLAALIIYFAAPHLSNNHNEILWNVWDLLQGIVLMCILITFLLFIRKKDKAARYFIVACLPVAIIWVVNYFVTNGSNEAFKFEWNRYYDRLELLCIASLVIILSWILFDRYNKLRKENAERALLNERLAKEKEIERSQLIAQQKVMLEEEVTERTAELKQSLEDLKAAEKQLIQSEKMASLGELTAGIAHEIQNPLNFVNNFSELSAELVDEMEEALQKDDKEEAIALAGNVKQNLEKINHHGKRADAIVKAMLQHTSSRAGKKELSDINSLTENYLRVCYDNACIKDNTFAAVLKTDFDKSIGEIEIVSADIGRVLVNLYNNAFYAASLPSKGVAPLPPEGRFKELLYKHEPTVWVTTSKIPPLGGGGAISISVRDNGPGIPHNIVDKIFQPFFTTKPTGQGTGLGLSLSYDIIKAHGGELKVETKEGEGTEFIIQLPVV